MEAGTPRTTAMLAAAAVAIAPTGSMVAGRTAAQLWGAWVAPSDEVTLRIPLDRNLGVRGIRVLRRAPVRPVTRFALPITSPTDTFLDLASELNLVELVVAGDGMVAAHHVSPQALVDASRCYRGPGARLARRAAGYVRSGVDSAPETRLRMLLVLAGLPEPTVNFIVRDEQGEWVRRHELAYPEVRLAIEYDGAHHAPPGSNPTGGRQWAKDLRRREAMDAADWRLIVIIRDDLARVPEAVLSRVCQALASRGVRVKVRSQEWRRFFPGWS